MTAPSLTVIEYLRYRDSAAIERERVEGQRRQRRQWDAEARHVAAHTGRLDIKPWDVATLPPPDAAATEATRRLLAAVPITRKGSTNGTATASSASFRANGTLRRESWISCPKTRHLATLRNNRWTFSRVGCLRATCDACRPYVRWREGTLILGAFEDVPMFAATIAERDKDTTRRRITRHGGDCVPVPAPGSRRIVLATVAPTNDARVVPTKERSEVVHAALAARPLDGRRMRGTRGFLPARRSANPATVVGFWSSRLTLADIERLVTEVGLTSERVLSTTSAAAVSTGAEASPDAFATLLARAGFRTINRKRDVSSTDPTAPVDSEPPPDIYDCIADAEGLAA